jgi:hypothetical protein
MLAALGPATGDADPAGGPPDVMRATIAMLWDEHVGPQARADGVPEHIIAFLHKRMLSNSPTGLAVMSRYLLACPDRTAELATLGGPPILVLYGENDDAWPPVVQERMARRLGAQRVCIPGAGHSPAVEAPETTASTLTAFWRAAEDSERRRNADPAPGSGHSGLAAPGGSGVAPGRGTPADSAPPPGRATLAGPSGGAPSPPSSPSHGRRGSEASLPSGQWAR